jgi:hypothetical protein
MYSAFTDKLECNCHFLAGTAWLTTKCYKIFPIHVKYRSIKTIKSNHLFYKKFWKWCPCTRTHSLHHLNRFIFIQRSSSWGTSKISLRAFSYYSFSIWGSTSLSWTECKNQLQKLILLARLHGCKAWTTVALYSQSLSSFVALAADDSEMPVSCARRLNDFCGVCSNLALISSCFLQ